MATDVDKTEFHQFQVIVQRDHKTGQVVAEVPALDIADFGIDSQEALDRLREMLTFHLECLVSEGKPVPLEEPQAEGLYLRVRLPVGAT